MRLLALSDLHVGFAVNREALASIAPRPEDWLILGGDLGETGDHLRHVFAVLGPRFRQLVWVPGNHELWTSRERGELQSGEAKYNHLVAVCREHGVLTPEDPYPVWPGEGGPHLIAPLFLLYDYSMRPADITEAEAVRWAAEAGVVASDEFRLEPAPHASLPAWCAARLASTAARLAAAPDLPTILINHWPLREDLIYLPNIPRYSLWCGTRATHDWHLRYRARVVVSGHLHTRRTDWIDGVRFEEVSLGYPRHWRQDLGIDLHLRTILPEPAPGEPSLPRHVGARPR
ncbi:MAG: metallophosphoesterase [Nannocystis sp.]|uniref:metallophosphoesterase family protein n=1 Tax=Nannocystis sp. TaxID=1962667 RepID=UPI002428720E|nr:metallophosphoesterase [Nannocystis sp.]MBK9755269.1 metallophosphoesterase [Nannocystis sp.]